MKIVFIGDCEYNTGPSNVNKDYKRYLENDFYFLKNKNKLLRVVETVIVSVWADTVVISGLSFTNHLSLMSAKLFKKRIIYLMHGCYVYETKINNNKLNKTSQYLEEKMLQLADKIVAVSHMYQKFVETSFPKYMKKMCFINNGFEWENEEKISHATRNKYYVLSMGGGRPQKNNTVVADAVTILNEKYSMPFQYIVLGRNYADTELLKQNKYTNYVGQVDKEEVKKWLKKTNIYIQNSEFESFGLAPIEALCEGCNLLLSKNIGAIDIINGITDEDIIFDCKNPNEIVDKILKIMESPNYKRLYDSIDKEETSCECSATKLKNLALELGGGKCEM